MAKRKPKPKPKTKKRAPAPKTKKRAPAPKTKKRAPAPKPKTKKRAPAPKPKTKKRAPAPAPKPKTKKRAPAPKPKTKRAPAPKPKTKKRAPAPKPKTKKRAPAPKTKKRKPRRPRQPQRRARRLELFEVTGPLPVLPCNGIVIVVTGALKRGRLGEALAVLDTLTRWLDPIAGVTAQTAWSREFRFRKRPVDADSILPALADIAPEVDVGDELRLSVGVLTTGEAYVPLAFNSSSLRDACDEALALAEQIRAKYGNAMNDDEDLTGDPEDVDYYEVRVTE